MAIEYEEYLNFKAVSSWEFNHKANLIPILINNSYNQNYL